MTELNGDTLQVDTTSSGRVTIEPQYLAYLREHGYRIEDVESVHVVESESRDMAHVVVEVVTYAYPIGHDALDYVAHETRKKVCSCADFTYNQSVDVSETMLADGTMGTCKHVRSCFRAEEAKADDQQTELGSDPE